MLDSEQGRIILLTADTEHIITQEIVPSPLSSAR